MLRATSVPTANSACRQLFSTFQKADLEAWGKFEKAGTQIIRMPAEDLPKFQRLAVREQFSDEPKPDKKLLCKFDEPCADIGALRTLKSAKFRTFTREPALENGVTPTPRFYELTTSTFIVAGKSRRGVLTRGYRQVLLDAICTFTVCIPWFAGTDRL